MEKEKIIICTYDERLVPEKKTHWAVCWDFKSAEKVVINWWDIVLVSTWVKISMPTWWWTKLFPRSSSPIKNWYNLANGVWIIDADYRWIYLAQILNLRNENIILEQYERIMQVEFFPSYIGSWEWWCWYIPELEIIVDQEKYDNFDKYYPSDRWTWWFWSTWKF
jgi:dUTPase